MLEQGGLVFGIIINTLSFPSVLWAQRTYQLWKLLCVKMV